MTLISMGPVLVVGDGLASGAGLVIRVEEASVVVVTTCAGGSTLAVELEPLTLRIFPT